MQLSSLVQPLIKLEYINVLSLNLIFLGLMAWIIVRYWKSLSGFLSKVDRFDILFMILLLGLRILVIFLLFSFHEPSFWGSAQLWTYKCQALEIQTDAGLFEKSLNIVNCHDSHATAFGFFIAAIHMLFGTHESVSLIATMLLQVFISILIYLFLRHLGGRDLLKRLSMMIIVLLFTFLPLTLYLSSITSVEYYATAFIVLFFLIEYFWERKKDSLLLAMLFVLMAILINVKFEYGCMSGALFIYLLVRAKTRKLLSKNWRHILLYSGICILLNLHLLNRWFHNSNDEHPLALDNIILHLAEYNGDHSIPIMIMMFSILAFVMIRLSRNFKKESYYLGYLFTFLFFMMLINYYYQELRYDYTIFVTFIVPFVMIARNSRYFKIGTLLVLFGIQFMFIPSLAFAHTPANTHSLSYFVSHSGLKEVHICNVPSVPVLVELGYFDRTTVYHTECMSEEFVPEKGYHFFFSISNDINDMDLQVMENMQDCERTREFYNIYPVNDHAYLENFFYLFRC